MRQIYYWFFREKYRRWGFLVLIFVLCASLFSGCSGRPKWNLWGEPFSDDSMSSVVKKARPASNGEESMGLSTKARQIEADFGIGQVEDDSSKSSRKTKSTMEE